MRIFFLRRLMGLAYVIDGLVVVFTPFNIFLSLKMARKVAKARFDAQKRA
jgi:hypothetical protein